MNDFPIGEIKALLAALRAKDYFAAFEPGIVVIQWLFRAMGSLGFLKPNASADGALQSLQPLSDADAIRHLEGFTGGETAASISSTTLRLLFQYLIANVLPKILDALNNR